MELYIALGVVAVLILGYIFCYNRLHKLQVKVEEGSAGIDVALEKRYDMLSEEIEAVKKYLNHEYDTYTSITAIRSRTEIEEQKLETQNHLSKEALDTINHQIDEQIKNMEKIEQQMKQQKEFSPKRNKAVKQDALKQGKAMGEVTANKKIGLLTSIHQGLSGVNSAVNAISEQYPVLYSSVSMEYFQKTIFDAEEHLQAARRLYNANVSLYNQALVTFPFLLIAKFHSMYKAEFYQSEEKKRNFIVDFDVK